MLTDAAVTMNGGFVEVDNRSLIGNHSYEAQTCVALIPRPARKRGFSCFSGSALTYIAYLDEFGHIGPYMGLDDPQHNDSPVFGLAGLMIPVDEVRNFGTWFYQRKCELLKFEIARSDKHPSVWEKKGSALYTVRNVETYRELRNFTNRLFNKIQTLGGFAFMYAQFAQSAADGLDVAKVT